MEQTTFKKVLNVREMILAGLVLFVLFVVFFKYVYSPRNTGLGDLRTKIGTLKTEKEVLEQETGALKKQNESKMPAPSKTADIRTDILNRAVKPQINSVGKFLQAVSQPDIRQGLVLNAVGSLKAQPMTGYGSFPFEIRASGGFAQIIRFIKKLSDLPGLVSVDSINLEMETGSNGQLNLNMVVTYYNLEGRL